MAAPQAIRSALIGAMQAGAVGTYDALAACAGLAPDQLQQVQTTLWHLCREGKAVVARTHRGPRRPGRPRAVYVLASDAGPAPCRALDAILCSAWR